MPAPTSPVASITNCKPEEVTTLAAMDLAEWGDWANALPLYRQLIDILPSNVLVARNLQDDILGFALILHNSDNQEGWLLSIDVPLKFRGLTVGKTLLKQALITLKSKQCKKVTAIISPENAVSLKLFTKAGFREIKREENYFRDGTPQLRLECSLT